MEVAHYNGGQAEGKGGAEGLSSDEPIWQRMSGHNM